MKPDARFANQPQSFWAHVRLLSQNRYTDRKTGGVFSPDVEVVTDKLAKLGFSVDHIVSPKGAPTKFGQDLCDYFDHRALVLTEYVEPRLMNVDQAKREFSRLKKALKPTAPLPMNKQKGKKKAPAYFTGIINMLIEASAKGLQCDFNPRQLTVVTNGHVPLQTMSRWFDGAFPSTKDPVAIWEIKEYYYTTTFGSRVADAVYETLLDGVELLELRERENVTVGHYLFVDSHFTWWKCGKSYLCRLIDALHMGYIDEVLFGSEVIERLPDMVTEWVTDHQRREKS